MPVRSPRVARSRSVHDIAGQDRGPLLATVVHAPRRMVSAMLAAWVPACRCAGLTHTRTSHRCRITG